LKLRLVASSTILAPRPATTLTETYPTGFK
jgi:hypothetical protein